MAPPLLVKSGRGPHRCAQAVRCAGCGSGDGHNALAACCGNSGEAQYLEAVRSESLLAAVDDAMLLKSAVCSRLRDQDMSALDLYAWFTSQNIDARQSNAFIQQFTNYLCPEFCGVWDEKASELSSHFWLAYLLWSSKFAQRRSPFLAFQALGTGEGAKPPFARPPGPQLCAGSGLEPAWFHDALGIWSAIAGASRDAGASTSPETHVHG
jgi:hypothetical protein